MSQIATELTIKFCLNKILAFYVNELVIYHLNHMNQCQLNKVYIRLLAHLNRLFRIKTTFWPYLISHKGLEDD